MKKILTFTLVIFLISLFVSGCKTQETMINTTTVRTLDLDKYLGKWYEIARYDNSFERGLVGVTANYSMRDDGKIRVLNSGYKGSLQGTYKQSVGKAKIPNPKEEPGKLKVSFFWFFYGDYYVLELDSNYQWAVVGSSTDKYLWILSRTPQISEELYQQLLQKIKARGYDTSSLIRIEQQ